ncbi:MAG: helix-turn-helix domain-containing protein [Phycisphaeraceae bacterium]
MNQQEDARTGIARRIALARQQAGLSQGQVAKLLEVHRPTISEMESGRRRVAAEELAQLASIYGVDVTWLTTGSEGGESEERISLAARELSKLKPDDLDRVMALLKTLKQTPGGTK